MYLWDGRDVWRSEDHLLESVLAFNPVNPGNATQIVVCQSPALPAEPSCWPLKTPFKSIYMRWCFACMFMRMEDLELQF